MKPNQMYILKISVCICTRNRESELRLALESIQHSDYPVHEVVVSDDSTNDETAHLISRHYENIKYVRGPHRGLSANRNNALRQVTGTHVLFIDDDVSLGEKFISNIISFVNSQVCEDIDVTIVTGLERNNGLIIFPNNQNFLGFQNRKYKSNEALQTIVINSTVFPMHVFSLLNFDEKIIYGYEEVDIATQAVQLNFKILLCDSAINTHSPSNINRDFYQPYVNASRLYVTFKRYFFTEKRRAKGFLFALLGTVHLISHLTLHHGTRGLLDAWRIINTARTYTLKYVMERSTL